MVKEKLFENILYEANYGKTPSTIKVKDFEIAFKRICQPINCMYPGDTIVTDNGESFTVGKLIDSNEKETVNKGVTARGTRVFTESDELFETDAPDVFVKRSYDSFMETELITLIDKSGSHDESTKNTQAKLKQEEKKKDNIVDFVYREICSVFFGVGLLLSKNRNGKNLFKIYRSHRGFDIEVGENGKAISEDGENLDPEDLLEDIKYFVDNALPDCEFTVYYDVSERDMTDELHFYVESPCIFE